VTRDTGQCARVCVEVEFLEDEGQRPEPVFTSRCDPGHRTRDCRLVSPPLRRTGIIALAAAPQGMPPMREPISLRLPIGPFRGGRRSAPRGDGNATRKCSPPPRRPNLIVVVAICAAVTADVRRNGLAEGFPRGARPDQSDSRETARRIAQPPGGSLIKRMCRTGVLTPMRV
jgi:hypothetical protein